MYSPKMFLNLKSSKCWNEKYRWNENSMFYLLAKKNEDHHPNQHHKMSKMWLKKCEWSMTHYCIEVTGSSFLWIMQNQFAIPFPWAMAKTEDQHRNQHHTVHQHCIFRSTVHSFFIRHSKIRTFRVWRSIIWRKY